MVHEKFLLQYIVCTDKLRDMSWLLGLATIKAYVYACEFYHWHLLDMSNHEPYLCMGFDCRWCISVCVITLLVVAILYCCWIDVTSSQSKHRVC